MEEAGIIWKLRETGRIWQNIVQNSMETYGTHWKLLYCTNLGSVNVTGVDPITIRQSLGTELVTAAL